MTHWFRRRADDVNNVDRAISRAISSLPPTPLDTAMKRLSGAANHGVLWFVVAAVLAARRGTTRKAAMRGVLSIALTSPFANGVLKPCSPPTPRRVRAARVPDDRQRAHLVVVPFGARGVGGGVRHGRGLGEPAHRPRGDPARRRRSPTRAIHVGVHWTSDVLVGAAVGTGAALATQRWWPVREQDEARARPLDTVPELPGGAGLVLVSNQRSGASGLDPADELQAALPEAVIVRADPDRELDKQLDEAVERAGTAALAVGVAGGDGSVAAAAAVAGRRGLPLVVVPTGTLNHFARDVGVYDLQEAVDATGAGQAVAVDLALVDVHPGHGDDPESTAVMRLRCFLNTASVGSYPDLVRLREQWEPRWGKWPAFAAALLTVLRSAEPVRVKMEGRWTKVWFLFVGNGPYAPRGLVPAWRPSLDSGLLDVRWLRADVRFSRLRAVLGLLSGALGHSRVYGERHVSEFDVELAVPGHLATDGEVVEKAGRFTFRVAPRPIPVYRRDERQWTGRDRPYQRV